MDVSQDDPLLGICAQLMKVLGTKRRDTRTPLGLKLMAQGLPPDHPSHQQNDLVLDEMLAERLSSWRYRVTDLKPYLTQVIQPLLDRNDVPRSISWLNYQPNSGLAAHVARIMDSSMPPEEAVKWMTPVVELLSQEQATMPFPIRPKQGRLGRQSSTTITRPNREVDRGVPQAVPPN